VTGRALVTGGGGFLGKAIVRLLVAEGHDVVSFSRTPHPDVEALGARHVCGDLADEAQVLAAVEGCDTVFHVAAKADPWGAYRDFFRTNVLGTRSVIGACRAAGVPRLVHTSSPCVVFDGRDLAGVDESAPYGVDLGSAYQLTKTVAELMALAASGGGLAVVALRPHLIWGPGDNHLVPRLVERARRGRLRLIGSGANVIDHVFVENAARAHLQAARHLAPGSPLAGRPYFITNGEPRPLAWLLNAILRAHALPPVRRRVPAAVAYGAGWLLERLHRTLDLDGEPLLTRFLAKELSTAHWFDISAARTDFGYEPAVTVDEGLERLRASVSEPLT
jgi:nucleoside-diphosphate-sugar epimerase